MGKAEGLNFSSTGHFFERVVVSHSRGTHFRADLTGACALDFGSFADPSSVGPAAELRGPRWAKERKKWPLWLVFPRWVESPDSPGEGEPSTIIFGVRG